MLKHIKDSCKPSNVNYVKLAAKRPLTPTAQRAGSHKNVPFQVILKNFSIEAAP